MKYNVWPSVLDMESEEPLKHPTNTLLLHYTMITGLLLQYRVVYYNIITRYKNVVIREGKDRHAHFCTFLPFVLSIRDPLK